jgi:hypothetical protein
MLLMTVLGIVLLSGATSLTAGLIAAGFIGFSMAVKATSHRTFSAATSASNALRVSNGFVKVLGGLGKVHDFAELSEKRVTKWGGG